MTATGQPLTARFRAWAWIVFTGVVLLDAIALLLPGDLAVGVPAVTTAVVWVALLSCFVLAQRRPVARSVGFGLAWSVPVTSVVLWITVIIGR